MSTNDYTVDLNARSGVDVRDFVVEYPGFKGHIPDFRQSAGMVYMSVGAPIPSEVFCSWRTTGAESKSLVVPLSALLPDDFDASRDKLIFSIISDESIALSVGLRLKRFHEKRVSVAVFVADGDPSKDPSEGE